jgi:hypothetical protein
MQSLVGKTERQGQLGGDKGLMLIRMLQKEYGWAWIGIIWLRIGTTVGLVSIKMKLGVSYNEISWKTDRL